MAKKNWRHKVASETYDAIVIGAGISGLGVGGLLARAGKKVCILESAHEVGGKCRSVKIDGYTFDMGPHATAQKAESMKLSALLGKGEAFEALKVPMKEGDISMACLKDGKWVNLYETMPNAEVVKKITQDVLEMSEAQVAKYDAISIADWLKTATDDQAIRDFIWLIAACALTHADPNNMAAGTYFRIMRDPDRYTTGLGPVYLKGGFGAWMTLLAEGCQELGATIKVNSKVTKIIVEDDRVQGVLVEEMQAHRHKRVQFYGGGELGAVKRIDAPVIINTNVIWELFDIIDPKPFPVWFQDYIEGYKGKKTAILGFWIGSRQPIIKEKWLVISKGDHSKLPFICLPLSNVVPEVAPEGYHLMNQISQVELDVETDKEKIYDTIELLKEDMDAHFPDWREKVAWIKPYYFHFEEVSHMPMQFGVFKQGPKAPKVEGLYFAGESVNTMWSTTKGAADSALICAREILATDEF
ncbi:MAG: NAD(P)/FAD-dependent oxidoreductase [Desulfatitalea sp.]|nr:NAD(P)/FAD-dependent oxidoreductase [Desulfatitalea sp.]NNJ99827.1 NAD(P)/FAD-dependent oxidoreductase [Desulfatitalea sp.]